MEVTLNQQEFSPITNDLVSTVRASLGKLSYHQLDDVKCSAEGEDHIMLSGILKSYYLKQIAQTIAVKVPGVRRVTNEILVSE